MARVLASLGVPFLAGATYIPGSLNTMPAASSDLPITLGVLAGSGQLASERFEQHAEVGEVSLKRHEGSGTILVKDCAY